MHHQRIAEEPHGYLRDQTGDTRDIDSDDEMLTHHSLRRGVMEQRSVAKTRFQASQNQPLPLDYGRIRGRLMMPTDLEKWSRDHNRMENSLKSVYQNETERLMELHQFIACGGTLAQKACFDEVIGLSQDQAIPGRDDSLELLICLQRPMMEISLMNSAFSALEQHVEESNALLVSTTIETQQDLEKNVNTKWTSEVLSSVPSREEFNAVSTQSERDQLSLPAQATWLDVSGFNIHAYPWRQPVPNPSMTRTAQSVTLTQERPPGTSPPSDGPGTLIIPDIHEGLNSFGSTGGTKTTGYYSAEDDEMYEI